uniref:Uncharacterized protein n=1 Tax=Anguilla anguilla TaxID=7936 RepID=A0A0E9VHH4_ANGAN
MMTSFSEDKGCVNKALSHSTTFASETCYGASQSVCCQRGNAKNSEDQ